MNTNLPFSVSDNVDHPVSLYAASKKSNELLAHTYSHLFDLPTSGLRFFTVYGPWGRPDMAAFLFTKAILEGEYHQSISIMEKCEETLHTLMILWKGVVRVSGQAPNSLDPSWSATCARPILFIGAI
jgi:UDP-glucuronate 4-epimerase